jgi:hypothetical protein
MSTSGSYDNITTLTSIIRDSFALINVIDDSETIPAEEYVYGRRMLNKLMSILSVHKGLWLISDTTVTLTPGTRSYTVGSGLTVDIPKPNQISHARRYVSSSLEIEMDVVSRNEYMTLPNKSTQAPPLMVYYEKLRDNGVLHVWPTGSSSEKTIIITTQRPIQDFDVESDNPDLPKEWVLCIEYLLAAKIAPKYLGAVPADVKSQGDEMLATLISDDEEKVSINFQPKMGHGV